MNDALVYAQGSRAIGATIVHGDSDDRFDLDAILEFSTPRGWSPGKILDYLEVSFNGFPDVRDIVRCTRCIQLQFAFMHLDVTPMDPASAPRAERVGDIYHSPEHGSDERFSVNPYGFAEWFKSQVVMPSRRFQDQVNIMRSRMAIPDLIAKGTITADAEIDELPAPVSPIRDAPQVIALKLMKRYLNLRYAKRNLKRPVSIYLSKIAVEVPPNQFGLCAQLEAFATDLEKRMAHAIEVGVRPEERNPAFFKENFNDRWPKDENDMKVFRADLTHLRKELARARQTDFVEIQDIFDRLFGERITKNAVRSYLDGLSGVATSASYERGKGFVAAPGLLAAAAAPTVQVSKAPAHRFHAGLLKK